MKVIVKLIAFLLIVMPFAVFGEDVTTTVIAFTNEEGGDVTKNVGDVTVTTKYDSDGAAGIIALAESNRTAKVTAKNVDVNVPSAEFQAGVKVLPFGSAGTVDITTNNIKSGEHGVSAEIGAVDSKAIVTVNGDIEAGAYDTELFSYRTGHGIKTNVRNNGTINVTVNGNVKAKDIGISIGAVDNMDPANGGTVNVAVYGDVISDGTSVGAGVEFFGHTDTADVLVTGTISGTKMGVASDTMFYPSTGESKLTVWKVESESGDLFTKKTFPNNFVTDDDFAKKANYIIKHADNVLPKKADGSAIAKSHNLPVAKEGEKVIIDTSVDGVYVEKAFNNGVEITTKDENGFFYVTVERGGGIDLSIETGIAQSCAGDPNLGQIGKECDNGVEGACYESGTYECNPATGVVACKYDIIDGRIEICGNNEDDDCDGVVDEEECVDVPALDTDGDGVPDNEDVCPNDSLNSVVMPEGGCFVNGSNIPERYDPNVPTDVIANPKTKVSPPFVLRDGNTVDVYYERFAGGVFKVGDTKFGKAKYEVMIKTKNKKKKATTKIVKQALTKNYRTIKLKKGQAVTVKYRVAITKKVGKKSVTKFTKWSKAEKFEYLPIN